MFRCPNCNRFASSVNPCKGCGNDPKEDAMPISSKDEGTTPEGPSKDVQDASKGLAALDAGAAKNDDSGGASAEPAKYDSAGNKLTDSKGRWVNADGKLLNKDGSVRKKPGRKPGKDGGEKKNAASSEKGTDAVPPEMRNFIHGPDARKVMAGLYGMYFSGITAAAGVPEAMPSNARIMEGGDALLTVARLYTKEWMKYLPLFALGGRFAADNVHMFGTIRRVRKARKEEKENE